VDKRTFIKSVVLGAAGVFALSFRSKLKATSFRPSWDGIYRLPVLPYALNSLEPWFDESTLKLHYHEHHAAYAKDLNDLAKSHRFKGTSAYKILRNSSKYPESVTQQAGGFFNHNIFWRSLSPDKNKKPSAEFLSAVEHDFGSFEAFKESFQHETSSVFGSGWAWLILDNSGRLHITSTQNNDNPLMEGMPKKGMPILCIDLWEHAYYMKNQHIRSEYVTAFWNVVDWEKASHRYHVLKSKNSLI
jgi:Fe-Mn family superoxide dismutase